MPSYELIRIEGIILNRVSQHGALVVYCPRKYNGKNVRVSLNGDYKNPVVVQIMERQVNGRKRHVAVFPALPVGTHRVSISVPVNGFSRTCSVFPDNISEVDFT
jgi:hypothetical protein